MRNRHRMIYLITGILITVGVLSACGGEKAPAEDVVKDDISSSLTANYPFLTMGEIELVQSMTKEESYTATASVVGKGEYANHTFHADVTYLKYDQGWQMSDCYWTELGYEIVTLPNAEQMKQLLQQDDSYILDSIREQAYIEAELLESGVLLLQGEAEESCPYLTRRCVVTTSWDYSPSSGQWSFNDVEQKIWNASLSTALEGTWPEMGRFEDQTITISNVTETSFDIDCSRFHSGPVHVELPAVQPDVNEAGALPDGVIYQAENVTCFFDPGYGSSERSRKSTDKTLYVGMDLKENSLTIFALIFTDNSSVAEGAITVFEW